MFDCFLIETSNTTCSPYCPTLSLHAALPVLGSMPTAQWVATLERWMEPKSAAASCWKSSPVAPSRSCRQRSHETQNCGAGGDSSRYRVVSRYRAEQNRASAPAIYRGLSAEGRG